MVLVHTGSPRGADKIADCWAAARKVPAIGFKPQWTGPGDKSAPFKRNDRLLEQALPIGLIVFPGNGINDNLVDKAKRLGVSIADHRKNDA
jgi:hypothetical protein